VLDRHIVSARAFRRISQSADLQQTVFDQDQIEVVKKEWRSGRHDTACLLPGLVQASVRVEARLKPDALLPEREERLFKRDRSHVMCLQV